MQGKLIDSGRVNSLTLLRVTAVGCWIVFFIMSLFWVNDNGIGVMGGAVLTGGMGPGIASMTLRLLFDHRESTKYCEGTASGLIMLSYALICAGLLEIVTPAKLGLEGEDAPKCVLVWWGCSTAGLLAL